MHESFMASYVFDHLGEQNSMAPEIMASTIWGWNHTKPMPEEVKKQQRIDLTLFAPQNAPKSEQHPWCFIELKRNWNVENDYWKLKSLLPLLECPFGAVCGVLEETEANTRQWLPKETPAGERFVVSRQWTAKVKERQRTFVVAGYLFPRDPPGGA